MGTSLNRVARRWSVGHFLECRIQFSHIAAQGIEAGYRVYFVVFLLRVLRRRLIFCVGILGRVCCTAGIVYERVRRKICIRSRSTIIIDYAAYVLDYILRHSDFDRRGVGKNIISDGNLNLPPSLAET